MKYAEIRKYQRQFRKPDRKRNSHHRAKGKNRHSVTFTRKEN